MMESAAGWRFQMGFVWQQIDGHPGLLQRKALQSSRATLRRAAAD